MQQMVIANRLADGAVVFLAAGDRWCTWIGDGRVLDEAEAELALATARRHEAENLVVEPSLIEVTVGDDGVPRPVAIREHIRAFGPTVGDGSTRPQVAGDNR
ncbi:MAG: DUF2849 domain-containing protein [Gammaproteobacteria bacterium]